MMNKDIQAEVFLYFLLQIGLFLLLTFVFYLTFTFNGVQDDIKGKPVYNDALQICGEE